MLTPAQAVLQKVDLRDHRTMLGQHLCKLIKSSVVTHEYGPERRHEIRQLLLQLNSTQPEIEKREGPVT
jgi:hypothetical protein